MVIWLSGAYGVGKSTTAKAILDKLENALIFDAEMVGNAVRDSYPNVPFGYIFEDYPLWAEFCFRLIEDVHEHHHKDIVVDMTLVRERSKVEIIDRLRKKGIDVYFMVLTADRQTIHDRILARGEEEDCWCMQNLDMALSASKNIPGAVLVNAQDRTPESVAEEILRLITEASIKQEEIDFPKLFADYVEKEYGILYYMKENTDSYDGNHAFLYPERIADLDAVLTDVTAFYRELGARANIYHPFVKNYFNDNLETLQKHGYSLYKEDDHRVMVLSAENQITAPKRLEIKVLQEWDDRVATDILIPSEEPWEIAVTKKRVNRDGAYLFVGYLGDKAVAYTDIHVSKHGNTRFDYIVTAKEHRGRGYASELLSFVVEYCKEQGFPVCWQWAGPSEHICYQAGFREVFTMEGGNATGPEVGK